MVAGRLKLKKIDKIKNQFKAWKVNQLDQVAKMKLKGKIENIDKILTIKSED